MGEDEEGRREGGSAGEMFLPIANVRKQKPRARPR